MTEAKTTTIKRFSEARNEVLVLDALAEIGNATATAIASKAGLTYNATRLALKRQCGFSVICQGQIWSLLDEPQEPPELPEFNSLAERRELVLESWLNSQEIEWTRLKVTTRLAWYAYETRASEIQIGDRITVAREGREVTQKVLRENDEITFHFGFKPFSPTRRYRADQILECRVHVRLHELDSMEILSCA